MAAEGMYDIYSHMFRSRVGFQFCYAKSIAGAYSLVPTKGICSLKQQHRLTLCNKRERRLRKGFDLLLITVSGCLWGGRSRNPIQDCLDSSVDHSDEPQQAKHDICYALPPSLCNAFVM